MSQEAAIGISIALFALLIIAFIATCVMIVNDSDYVTAAIVTTGIFLVLGVGSLFWSLNDNYYDVKAGTVIAQDYTPAHYTAPIIISTGKSTTVVPGHYEPDDWAIEIKDESGRTGWIHFDSDVLASYPSGSHYPS